MLDYLLSLVAPHVCLGCGSEGDLWCEACYAHAPEAVERCFRCHRLSAEGRTCVSCQRATVLYAVRAATRYETTSKQLIWRVKFERARTGAATMAMVMVRKLPMPSEAIITYVPTSTGRVRRRGYDQAGLVARSLSRRCGLPYAPSLLRLGQKQQRSASRELRLHQLADAFLPINIEKIHGRHVVLVDDVITTGATLDAAASALKAAGAKRVSAVVFAQA